MRFSRSEEQLELLEQIMAQYCSRFTLELLRNEVVRDDGASQERDYDLILKNENDREVFLEALRSHAIAVRRFNKQSSELSGNEN